jgi:hypothetical protein
MESPLTSSVPTGSRGALPIFLVVVAAAGLLGIIAFGVPSVDTTALLLPTLATLAAFGVFTVFLARRVGDHAFGEIGFVYLGLAVAYTLVPALAFLVLDLDSARVAQFLPAPSELGVHLWRHALFVSGVAAGYLLFRGKVVPELRASADSANGDWRTIAFLVALIGSCVIGVYLLSAPVTTYMDHYTRFDHLSWTPLQLAHLCLTLKSGGYFILMTFLFRKFAEHRLLTLSSVAAICSYELAYSFGSRIETLIILLGGVCLYHERVRTIRLRQGVVLLAAIAALFSVIELFRASGFDVGIAEETVSKDGPMPAAEFSAVYFTGFHLYSERAHGSLPNAEWPMFFSEFVLLTPFMDHTRWNPMYWYARNYFPAAVVPPETMGPIAESAIWGGEIDLLFRSLINGIFFAYLVRWYLCRKTEWWAVVVYAYCYASCVMTLKYSVFYLIVPLVRVVLPALLVVGAFRRLITPRSMAVAATVPEVSSSR